jgi:hypothetical protein
MCSLDAKAVHQQECRFSQYLQQCFLVCLVTEQTLIIIALID